MTARDTFAVKEAKDFLKNRVVTQAAEENVALSPAEIATLTYSEPAATLDERVLADEVGAGEPSGAYEQKISALIRNAYKADEKAGRKQDWDRQLQALRAEDLYILVMVQSAGVPFKPDYIGAIGQGGLLKSLLSVHLICLAAVGVAGVTLLFTPLGAFIRSDVVRGLAFVVWIAALWGVGGWSRRRAFRQ